MESYCEMSSVIVNFLFLVEIAFSGQHSLTLSKPIGTEIPRLLVILLETARFFILLTSFFNLSSLSTTVGICDVY